MYFVEHTKTYYNTEFHGSVTSFSVRIEPLREFCSIINYQTLNLANNSAINSAFYALKSGKMVDDTTKTTHKITNSSHSSVLHMKSTLFQHAPVPKKKTI